MLEQLIGFYENMPFEEYAAVDALNGSALVHMMRSPLNFRWHEDNPQPPTDAMKLGTMIHSAILDPPLLEKIAVWGTKPEEKVRNGKVWDAFESQHADKTIMTRAEYEEACATVEGVLQCPAARAYLNEKGPAEISMFWIDPADGRYWKGRLDKLIRTKHTATIVDLKKTRSCSAYRFGAQAFSLGYHIKAAIYVSGYQILTGIRPKFRWIAMESKPPYECAVYRATDDVLVMGGQECERLTKLLDECTRTDHWPMEQEGEEDLPIPSYVIAQADAYEEEVS